MSVEKELENIVGKRQFTEKEVARFLNLSKSNAHYIRHRLLKEKKIVRVKRGIYQFGNPSEYKIGPFVEFIRNNLQQLNKNFVITATSFFNRFYPTSNFIVIYTEKRCADQFMERLESMHLNFIVLYNPPISAINLLRDKVKARNFIIVREKNYFYGSKDYLASLETAFVDYYFEVTRGKLPIEDKVDEILDYIFTHYSVNRSKMLRYAKERGIRKEIEGLLYGIKFSLNVGESIENIDEKEGNLTEDLDKNIVDEEDSVERCLNSEHKVKIKKKEVKNVQE